jgi:hypothetical protein
MFSAQAGADEELGCTCAPDPRDSIADRARVHPLAAIDAILPSGTIVRPSEVQVTPTRLTRSLLHDSGLTRTR